MLAIATILSMLSFNENSNSINEHQTKDNDQVAVSATKMNVLYVGIENPLDIAVANENNENISVTTDNGIVTKNSSGKWIASVVRTGQTTIQVFIEKDGKKILYGEKIFRALRVADPMPTIAGKKDLTMDKQSILNNPILKIDLENFLYDMSTFNVVSFTFHISDNNTTKEVKCAANMLNNEALELLKNVNSGSIVTFDDIKVVGPDGSALKIQPLYIKIK